MVFNKMEDTINWEEIKIKLDFDNENDTDKIGDLWYINQSSDIHAVKILGEYNDSQLNFQNTKYVFDQQRKTFVI